MFGIGPMELVVIVVVALLIFGPQKLPELARTLGKGLAELRRASNDLRQSLALDELQNDLRKTMNDATRLPPIRPAQAGDGLPPGSGATAPTSGASAGPAAPTAPTGPVAAAAPGSEARIEPDRGAAATPPWKNNPGELPEGGDHDHHDAPVPTPIDPGLGSVPVGGADPDPEARRG